MKDKTGHGVEELKEKIFELSIKLKNKNQELEMITLSNKKLFNKLIHNLKNPIGTTYSFSEIISGNLKTGNSERLVKYIDIIYNSSKHSIELLNSFAYYLKFQSTKYNSDDFKNVDCIQLVQGCIERVSPIALINNIKIEKKFKINKSILKLQETAIKLAIEAVLNNAVRYTKPYGKITIEVSKKSSTIEISISDNGIGISQSDLPHIFEEFYVVNTYSCDKKKCIGLGLTIATNILKNNNGKINVTSSLGKGSRFIISLPK